MSEYNFKGGSFEITMADSKTAALIAATQNLSLSFANIQQGTELGRVSGPDLSGGQGFGQGF